MAERIDAVKKSFRGDLDEVAEYLDSLPELKAKSIVRRSIDDADLMKKEYEGFYFGSSCTLKEYTSTARNAWGGTPKLKNPNMVQELAKFADSQKKYKSNILTKLKEEILKPGIWSKGLRRSLTAFGFLSFYGASQTLAAPTAEQTTSFRVMTNRYFTCLGDLVNGRGKNVQHYNDLADATDEYMRHLDVVENHRKEISSKIRRNPFEE